MALPIGLWSTFGAGLPSVLWRAANPPVDPYRTLANGQVFLAGESLRQACTRGLSDIADGQFGYAGGGTYDTDREVWIATQSTGHFQSGTNEVDEFNAVTGGWTQVVPPTVELFCPQNIPWPSTGPNAGIPYGNIHPTGPLALRDVNNHYPANVLPSTGSGQNLYPNTGQQYGCITYMPAPYRKLWTSGGAANWDASQYAVSMIFEYDVIAKKWQAQDADRGAWGGGAGGGSGFPGGACWDSTYQRVLFHDYSDIYQPILFAYDPAKQPGQRVTTVVSGTFNAGCNCETTAVWDAKRKRMLLFGGDINNTTQGVYFDFSAGPANPTRQNFTWSVGGYPGFRWQGLGVFYDALRDRYIYAPFDGTRTLISIHPDTFAATLIGPATGTAPAALRYTPEHMYGRFFHVRSTDTYVAIVNASDTTAFAYQPAPVASTSTTAPTLAFTDLWQGRNTGNPDTSFGQTANVDGAYVTVFGPNLGNTQGTSTLTLGGVAQRVIAWGPAQPPICAADLNNEYLKLQAIIFQIVAATPQGAQPLVVTVNGVASAALPFTVVNQGVIAFANASSAFSIVPNMGANDITYFVNGTTISGGLQTPTGARDAQAPLALVAAPNATVTIGDATHNSFPVTSSGASRRLTYAKLNLFGANNAPALEYGTLARTVGNKIQAPNGTGRTGTVGCSGSSFSDQIRIFGNEWVNCGIGDDDGYHVVYLSSLRNGTGGHQDDHEVAWNYGHECNAFRFVNVFNANGTPGQLDTAMGDIRVHHNVIVNQQGAGIGILAGCVGVSSIHDNVLINCGLGDFAGVSAQIPAAFEIRACFPPNFTPDGPITVDCYNNTVLNGGTPSGVASRGAIYHANGTSHLLRWRNNLVCQANGAPYYAQDPFGLNGTSPSPSNRTNNAWFGAGPAPTWDTAAVTRDPLLVSTVFPYDTHVQSGSPCINAGIAIGGSIPDLDGDARPPTPAPWSIGADEPSGAPSAAVVTLSCVGGTSVVTGGALLPIYTTISKPIQSFNLTQQPGLSAVLVRR